MTTRNYIVITTLIFLLFTLILEYMFNKSYSFLYSGKDGGILFRIKFLFIFSLIEISVRYQFKVFSSIIFFYILIIVPIFIIISYFLWFYLLPDDGIGFMLLFLGLVLISHIFFRRNA
jgi:hypothetical protein